MDTSYSVAEVNEYRNNIMLYILNNSVNKLPIKVSEIVEKVVEKRTKAFNYCFPLAREALAKEYGLYLREVPESKSGKKFICYSRVYARSSYEFDKEQQRQITLLFIVLSYILMSGTPVYEAQLENFLSGLKIYFDGEHDYFGPFIKKLITETFAKQLYLKKTKSESELDTEIKYLYDWGFRGTVEFKKKHVLEQAAKILGKPPSYFVVQYEEVCADSEEEDEEMPDDDL